jgi:hypothetical protein
MAQTIKINGVTYDGVKEMKVPLASDTTRNAVFMETSDATATAASIKDGETAYVGGAKVEGTMPVNGVVSGKISAKDGTITIPDGYTPGGTVALDETEKAKLIPGNIRQGVTVLGVTGAMSPSEAVNAQSKTVTPTKSQQVVQPDSGYTHLAQVTVEAIPTAYITTTDANATADDIKNGKTAYVNGKKVTGSHTDPAFTLANGVLSIV